MTLSCKQCGARVIKPETRACGHVNAGVIASLHATCYGEGGATTKKVNPIEGMIRRVIELIKAKQT